MKSLPAPILDAPQTSQVTATPRIRGISTFALGLFADAARLPYVTVDTCSRPLAKADRWPSRQRQMLMPSDTVSLIAGIAALTPIESLHVAELIEGMQLYAGAVAHETPWTNENPANRSLHEFLEAIVVELMQMDDAARERFVAEQVEAGWQLHIIPMHPFFARFVWSHEGYSYSMDFHSSWSFQEAHSPAVKGVGRVTTLPFSVLGAAATACVEANRRATGPKSRIMKPAGLRGSASSAPEMEKAAGPDDHNDLSNSLQPEAASSNSIVGREPANEQTHEVSNEQCKARPCGRI